MIWNLAGDTSGLGQGSALAAAVVRWFWADPQAGLLIAILVGLFSAIAGGLIVEATVRYFGSATSRNRLSRVGVSASGLKAWAVLNILTFLSLHVAFGMGVYRKSDVNFTGPGDATVAWVPPQKASSAPGGETGKAEARAWMMEMMLRNSRRAHRDARILLFAVSGVILINAVFGLYFLRSISIAEQIRQPENPPDRPGA